MPLRTILSSYWCAFQEHLFPAIEEDLGPLGERYQLFITVLELGILSNVVDEVKASASSSCPVVII